MTRNEKRTRHNKRATKASNKRTGSQAAVRRVMTPEKLESRQLLAADPIHVGVVYLETDYLETDQDVGGDSQGDRFILSFNGGAPETELTTLRISTDKDGDGISVGDPIFDTQPGGRGKDLSHGFQIVRIVAGDGRQIDATAEVEDGGQELVLRLSNFRAGDRLEFTLDVDEVLRNVIDLDVFNDRLDVITSGQEFQDSILDASFVAPHYEATTADAIFLNDYGSPDQEFGLDLPPDQGDDIDSRANRSAAAIGSVQQVPKPISISGHVWIDNDLDLLRELGEPLLNDIELSLWKLQESNGRFIDTGHRATTNADGFYEFSKLLALSPGQYQVAQTQPAGLFSVGAVPGQVDGTTSGRAESVNLLTNIIIPLGDQTAVNYDFAEAQPASIKGYVYQDDNDDGQRDSNEKGIAGVTIQLLPIDTIAPQATLTVTTAADGSYAFTGLAPGQYEVIEVAQPPNLTDGKDTAGTVDGITVGIAENPGDKLSQIMLAGGDDGIEYNFGELSLGSLSGYVYVAAPGEDCTEQHDADGNMPLAGVIVELQTIDGVTISRMTTGADGGYIFDDVPRGEYRIVEFTPAGLIDGESHVGVIDGVKVGDSVDGGLIQGIDLTPGGTGTQYNFCEAVPAKISGYVYEDDSNDGIRDADEAPIAGVIVSLIDSDNQVVSTATTDDQGHYEFEGIYPGEYSLVETHPAGYHDGIDTPGKIAGVTAGRTGADGDSLRQINIRQGQTGIEYNFGELRGATLSGQVHADTDGDCDWDPGEETLEGVVIRLIDSSGNEVARTTTDADGRYTFSNIAPGDYSLVEEQPDGYFDGDAVPGSAGGTVDNPNTISKVTLTPGEDATDYDFCEIEPSSISGFVYVDQDGDCIHDEGEPPLVGVTIELRDAQGKVIETTVTDVNGYYVFDNLMPGDYSVYEHQPDGYFHGGQTLGSGGGEVLDDDHLGVQLGAGSELVNYDFCELAPASISGSVWQETDLDQDFGPGDEPIAGVVIELIDENGNVIATTETDSQGNFFFDSIAPGVYSLREVQPPGFFHGGEVVGSAGGEIGDDDLLVGIVLEGGMNATDYDFPEVPPAVIAGYVFQDGDALVLDAAPDPTELREYRDGIKTHDDSPIAGVQMELRTILGTPFDASNALPGVYPDGPIRATTDADGYYEFTGLRPGSYHVYQVQPEDYIDSLDTPGTEGGLAVNPADTLDEEDRIVIQTLSENEETNPRDDAILSITLSAGGRSHANNFSEILIKPNDIPPLIQRDPPETPERPLTPIEIFDPRIRIVTFADPLNVRNPLTAYDEWAVTWHLSVINGGFPRGIESPEGFITGISSKQMDENDEEGEHISGRWTLVDANGQRIEASDVMTLGEDGATALTGDFDGDGKDQAAIYAAGQWFVDLNGNGVWDAGDLWIQLGTQLDRPVVGDWDGDGKDDIAIFGRQWERDPQKIKRDPGLPDPDNKRRRIVENRNLAAYEKEIGEDRKRLLRRGTQGELRADAVDHVFSYGEQIDTPIAGDWNGDGIDQIAIFREGVWMLDSDGDGRWTADNDTRAEFGLPGDEPVVGDFNGDGIDEIGVVRGDLWIIDTDGDRKITANDTQIEVPRQNGDSQPITGDWDGDGKDEPGYYDEAA